MTFIPIENLDMKIAQIGIAQQDFYSASTRVTLGQLICDDANVITKSLDSKTFTLASGYDYFMIASMNGLFIGGSGNLQICFGFYNETSSNFFQYQSASRLIKSHDEFRGHCSSTIEAMILNVQTSLPISIRFLPASVTAGYFQTYYNGDTSPASAITIMYKPA